MKTRLINLWDDFRESFWFVPIAMSLFAVIAAIVLGAIDSTYTDFIDDKLAWIRSTPSTSRAALSAIASAMLTLVGVVLSITMVAVSMASSQYGSRLLRCFMTDSLADYVMGTFVGTGLFCMIALRSVRDASEATTAFTPHLSTAIAVVMSLFSIGLLIYFIHDVSISIQAPKIVEALANDLNAAIDRLYPEKSDDQPSDESNKKPTFDSESAFLIKTNQEGYVQGIDYETLAEAASSTQGLIRLTCQPGQFLTELDEFAQVTSSRSLSDEEYLALTQKVKSALVIGARRTPRQDVVCSVLEVVDVAVRSLSPGINDPFTAMNCIDRLGAALAKMARRDQPPSFYCDQSDEPRVIVTPVTCTDAIHAAFQQIRQHGTSSVAVAIRLLEALTTIAKHVKRPEDFMSIALETQALHAGVFSQDFQAVDLQAFEKRYATLMKRLEPHVDMDQLDQ